MELAYLSRMLTRSRTQIRPTEYLLDQTTILIVDDEPGPRESLKMILSPAHRVICCSSGAEALAALQSASVDVVTLDLNMPGMKGDELMRKIRTEFPTVEIIIITGCGTVRTAVEGLRHGISDYISKPFDVVQVSTAVSEALARRRCRDRMVEFLEGVGHILGMHQDSRNLIATLDASRELQNRLRSTITERELLGGSGTGDDAERMLEFLNVLAQALESRDSYLRGHAQRVSGYAELVARRLELSDEECEHVRVAAFLHDFGKLALADTDAEPAQQRGTAEGLVEENHPELGARLVKPLGFAVPVVEAIAQHHERWDGEGFPSGNRGDEIPLAARILSVADAYDGMMQPRTGVGMASQIEAVAALEKQAGHQLDPEIVQTFVALCHAGELSIEEIESTSDLLQAACPA